MGQRDVLVLHRALGHRRRCQLRPHFVFQRVVYPTGNLSVVQTSRRSYDTARPASWDFSSAVVALFCELGTYYIAKQATCLRNCSLTCSQPASITRHKRMGCRLSALPHKHLQTDLSQLSSLAESQRRRFSANHAAEIAALAREIAIQASFEMQLPMREFAVLRRSFSGHDSYRVSHAAATWQTSFARWCGYTAAWQSGADVPKVRHSLQFSFGVVG